MLASDAEALCIVSHVVLGWGQQPAAEWVAALEAAAFLRLAGAPPAAALGLLAFLTACGKTPSAEFVKVRKDGSTSVVICNVDIMVAV